MKMPIMGAYIKPTPQLVDKAKNAGFHEVYSPPSKEVAKRAEELGLFYAPLIWVPETKDPRLGVVNIFGSRKLFAFNNSGCPANPLVQESALKRIENAVSLTNANTVILDALRYPSPYDMETFFSCFCEHCQEFMKSMGINPHELKNSLKLLLKEIHKYPYLPPKFMNSFYSYILFKQTIIENFAAQIHKLAENLNIKLWAATFPPSLAWMVGQNYSALSKYIDEFHIMLYHKCNGAACLNKEIASLINLLQKTINKDRKTIIISLSKLLGIDIQEDPAILENKGININILIREFETAKINLEEKSIPLFLHYGDITKHPESPFTYKLLARKITLFIIST